MRASDLEVIGVCVLEDPVDGLEGLDVPEQALGQVAHAVRGSRQLLHCLLHHVGDAEQTARMQDVQRGQVAAALAQRAQRTGIYDVGAAV